MRTHVNKTVLALLLLVNPSVPRVPKRILYRSPISLGTFKANESTEALHAFFVEPRSGVNLSLAVTTDIHKLAALRTPKELAVGALELRGKPDVPEIRSQRQVILSTLRTALHVHTHLAFVGIAALVALVMLLELAYQVIVAFAPSLDSSAVTVRTVLERRLIAPASEIVSTLGIEARVVNGAPVLEH